MAHGCSAKHTDQGLSGEEPMSTVTQRDSRGCQNLWRFGPTIASGVAFRVKGWWCA